MSRQRRFSTCAAPIAIYILLAVPWLLAVPAFEKPDEIYHIAYVQFVARNWRIPVQGKEGSLAVEFESQQPPLFYFLAAIPYAVAESMRAIQPTDVDPWLERATTCASPPFAIRFWQACDVGLPRFPYDVFFVRVLCALVGLGVIVVTYRLGQVTSGRETIATLAAFIVALLPQFLFHSTGVSNDVFAWLYGGIIAVAFVRLRGTPQANSWKACLLVGILCGFGPLVKASTYSFLPCVVLFLPRDATRKELLRDVVIIAAAAIVIGGWWFVRNQWLYGDLLGRQEIISPQTYAWNIDPKPITDPYFRGPFWLNLFESAIARFAYGRLDLNGTIYKAAGLLSALVVLAGMARAARGGPRAVARRDMGWRLCVLPLMAVAGVTFYNLSVSQPQGKYLFHTLPVLAVLAAFGIESLSLLAARMLAPGASVRLAIVAGTAAIGIALNLYCLCWLVIPFYEGIGVGRVLAVAQAIARR